MIIYRNKLNFVTIQWLWLLCLILAALDSGNTWIFCAQATQTQSNQPQQHQLKSTLQQLQQEAKSNGLLPQQQQQDVTVHNFSPRIDYNNNEWRPVGRGDPLKNDPTFDYSPPTLDRVRYWADPEKDKEKLEEAAASLVDVKLKKANPGKNEILLLGVTGDRMRNGNAALHQHAASVMKNAKGETPLLQPKYTSIRRSYYAHQLPTHLMPPPMIPATQQNQPQQSHPQQVQAMHIAKPVQTEYRHSYMNSSPMSSMSAHAKPYYMSAATQPWMHTSGSPSMGTSASSSAHLPLLMSGNSHRYSQSHAYSHGIDSNHLESMNSLSYHIHPRPTSTPSIMSSVNTGMGRQEFYSPNAIRGSSSGHHSLLTSSKKPWIHDLLQKEFVKPIRPTPNPNLYNIDTIKPLHMEPQHFEHSTRSQGISTTYAPVTFVTPTIPSTTSTTHSIYITSNTHKQTTSTSHSPMYSTTPPTQTSQASRTTTTLSPTRLLIPNTSNLAYRPTVAPLKMTTDSLFSHYNQPDKPLRGPMYLIIEGHSKVKTYGKDELDPHKPKIVPVIPKREPVVRIADPNEKRGTPETFQVKHLHTTPSTTSTTSRTTTKPTKHTITTSTNATTSLPKTISKVSTTVKPTLKQLQTDNAPSTTTTTTTVKPATTKAIPKLSVTTSATKPKLEKPLYKETKSLSKNKKPGEGSPNALDTSEKPTQQAAPNEAPTGMQGLLSLLDSSLDSIFKRNPINENDSFAENGMEAKDASTKLKLIPMKTISTQQHVEPRVSTKLHPIKAEDYPDYENDNYFKLTTEYLPRETRQIFDYDQLPESRVDFKNYAHFGALLEQLDDEDDLSAFSLDDEYVEDENEAEEQGLREATASLSNNKNGHIKRVDTLTNSSTETENLNDDFSSLLDDDLNDDETDLPRSQQRQNQIQKA